jgi:hypothetical protein
MFGLPWRTAMSLVHGAGLLLGVLIFWAVGFGWCSTVVRGNPARMDCIYTMSASGLLVLLVGTAIISLAAFFGNFEETWHRLGILAAAGGFLISGLWTLAIHRIEVHPDRLVVRGPVIPIATTYSLTDGNRIVTRIRRRPPSAYVWGRRQRNGFSVHFISQDGSERLLCSGRGGCPLWSRAAPHFEHEYTENASDKDQ